VWELTPREICNVAYTINVRGAQQPQSEDDPSIEDQIMEFEESIGQRVNSSNRALEQLHEHMRAMGKDPDAQEMPDEVAARIARDSDTGMPDWMREEQEARQAELAFTKGRKKKQPETDGWDMDIEW
jgi:hypothetical protein